MIPSTSLEEDKATLEEIIAAQKNLNKVTRNLWLAKATKDDVSRTIKITFSSNQPTSRHRERPDDVVVTLSADLSPFVSQVLSVDTEASPWGEVREALHDISWLYDVKLQKYLDAITEQADRTREIEAYRSDGSYISADHEASYLQMTSENERDCFLSIPEGNRGDFLWVEKEVRDLFVAMWTIKTLTEDKN